VVQVGVGENFWRPPARVVLYSSTYNTQVKSIILAKGKVHSILALGEYSYSYYLLLASTV
jgi:hypothetical protein